MIFLKDKYIIWHGMSFYTFEDDGLITKAYVVDDSIEVLEMRKRAANQRDQVWNSFGIVYHTKFAFTEIQMSEAIAQRIHFMSGLIVLGRPYKLSIELRNRKPELAKTRTFSQRKQNADGV